jgi:hypothetical protein
MVSGTRRARCLARAAGHIPADVFRGRIVSLANLRMRPFQGGSVRMLRSASAGMLVEAAAHVMSAACQFLESSARERVMNRTVDGDVLPDATRGQMYRPLPVT